ncbi:MAG: helix-turn-helix domain-containing protein [Solirubrobacteraceae bacterium]|nr:helix-turn-helix domain-containing protein [Solirubrobacteraceae bacterium]
MGSPAVTPRLEDLARLRRVRDRIDREYARPLDVAALARGVHMSSGHLSRQFRLAYGESPYSYLMTRRIERAMALLRRGDLTVTEVCLAVGCQSLGTFSTRFAELVGMPPGAYRRQAVGAGTDPGTEPGPYPALPACVARKVARPVRSPPATAVERPAAPTDVDRPVAATVAPVTSTVAPAATTVVPAATTVGHGPARGR